MSEQELAKLPKCHFCKQPVGDGIRTKAPPGKRLYLCDTCHDLLRAVVHDIVGSVYTDIAAVLSNPDDTWVEHMESYSYADSQP